MDISRNTKMLYVDALVTLCDSKNLKKITIQDILDYTDTARQTFYNHFIDKQDLINFIYNYHETQIIQKYFTISNWSDCLKHIMDFCLSKKNFFIQASKLEGQNNFEDYFFESTVKSCISRIREGYGDETLTSELLFAIRFNSYGARGMFMSWIREGMLESTEEIAVKIYASMPNILKQFVK